MEFIQTLCTIGSATLDQRIVDVIRNVITAIQIGVPILLVIWGMLDLGKAVIAQKEDEIKKGQQVFMKRLLAAAIVFFVVIIVKFVFSFAGGQDTTGCLGAILQW